MTKLEMLVRDIESALMNDMPNKSVVVEKFSREGLYRSVIDYTVSALVLRGLINLDRVMGIEYPAGVASVQVGKGNKLSSEPGLSCTLTVSKQSSGDGD